MAQRPIVGLHHVTAIASDPQRNLDFYTHMLGLRFVKRTINFDDPSSYHFYFGDDVGSPGTILTFFPWPRATRGFLGAGEVTHTAFSVPQGSLAFWQNRLSGNGSTAELSGQRFDDEVLSFADPDGMQVEIVAHAGAPELNVPRYSSVPPEHAICGFFGVTLLENRIDITEPILNVIGFHRIAQEGQRIRFAAAGTALGNHIDVVVDPSARRGRAVAGSVHHIAFRTPDDASQLEWKSEIEKYVDVTPVQERTYFQSIYFREPGGVLFELATDEPGFAIDESPATLGEALCLPDWLEPRRAEIERSLLPITLTKEPVSA